MKRFLLAIAVLSLMTAGLVGCHASGDIGSSASITAPR
jgi:hypothetical protein